MIYFKNSKGDVFAYESQEVRDEFGAKDLVAMTPAEVDEHINPPSRPLTREEVTELRRLAYADPLTGSDPLYIEYQRSVATGASEEDIHASKSAWLARAEEIATQYPWPE